MKHLPIMLPLAVILFIALAIPTVLLTSFSGNMIIRYSEESIAESSLSSLEASRKLVESELDSISKSVVRLASTYRFIQFRNYPDYRSLSMNFDYISEVQFLHHELQSIRQTLKGIHSAFFYLDNSDYVVATDVGIALLRSPNMVSWIPESSSGQRIISGEWHPRILSGGTPQPVLSFILPLNNLTTSTKGTIVANLLESQIGDFIGPSSNQGEQIHMLIDQNGNILSHPNKELIFTKAENLPFTQELLVSPDLSGYQYLSVDGERKLYTFSKSKETGWTYIGIQSMASLMDRTEAVRRNMNIVMAGIMLAGALLASFLASLLSRPARNLARSIKSAKGFNGPIKNELIFLESAFKKIQEEGEDLHQRLMEREQDSEILFLQALLRGDIDPSTDQDNAAHIFPFPCFKVAIIALDGYDQYVKETNAEVRMYHRFLYLPLLEEFSSDGICAKCAYVGKGIFGFIINYTNKDHQLDDTYFANILLCVKNSAKNIFGHTVTIGTSKACNTYREVFVRAAEALETTKRRIVHGNNSIIYWRPEYSRSKKYVYPSNSEKHIINYLATKNFDLIKCELENVRAMILSDEYISYDNILFVYNQIVGATIKYLGENNIGFGRIFAYRGNIYATIASFDTVFEIEEYLKGFFADVLTYLNWEDIQNLPNPQEQILSYLKKHYKEDIIFEDVAAKIGVSYSHMRKLVRDATGNSAIDYVNTLRIQEVKRLLGESGLSISQIAAEVGYRNVQSLNRFFRKKEGMSPSEYKNKS